MTTENSSTVLIVEDNKELTEIISENLSNYYSIITAKNGKAALSILETTIPDMILLDIMLPFQLDGFSILKKIKNENKLNSVPVIIMSALVSDLKITEALNLGANDYITKPFRIGEMILKIKNLIGLKHNILKQLEKEIILKTILANDTNDLESNFKIKFEDVVENLIANQEISIHFIAEKLTMSVSKLERWVRKIYGIPPKQYIQMS